MARLVTAALVAGLLVWTAGARAADFTLRFATINVAGTLAYDQILVPFARTIETESAGRIAVDIKPLGGYGKPLDLLPMVERGDIEIASTVQGYHPGRFPRSSVVELPLVYDSAVAGTTAFWGLYADGLLGTEYDGLHVLSLYCLPPYGIFVAEQPSGLDVRSLRDLRGLRVRAPSVTIGLALAQLGAIPIGLPLNMMGDTLHAKLIDAIAYGWDSTTTSLGYDKKPLIDQVRTLVDMRIAAPGLMIVMNGKAYERLPADLRAVIDRHAGLELSLASARQRDESEATTKARLRLDPAHLVLTPSDAERKAVQTRLGPVLDQWQADMAGQGIDGAKLLQRMRALAAGVS